MKKIVEFIAIMAIITLLSIVFSGNNTIKYQTAQINEQALANIIYDIVSEYYDVQEIKLHSKDAVVKVYDGQKAKIRYDLKKSGKEYCIILKYGIMDLSLNFKTMRNFQNMVIYENDSTYAVTVINLRYIRGECGEDHINTGSRSFFKTTSIEERLYNKNGQKIN